jgi:hypothetical protein
MIKFTPPTISSSNQHSLGHKPDLILHIGTEKTGTTTIQEFLHLNRKLLAKNEIYFPKSIGMRNHRPLASWCLSDNREDVFLRMNNLIESTHRRAWREDFSAQFETEISELQPEIKRVIISSEHFSALLKRRDEIETLRLLLDKWFKGIKVIVYLRRQDGLAVSAYSTACRAGSIRKRILPDPEKMRPFVNYQKLLQKWSIVFGKDNIHPAIYEITRFYNSELLFDFMYRCGLPFDLSYHFPENKNKSLSAVAQEVAQLFNANYTAHSTGISLRRLHKIRTQLIETVNAKYSGAGKMPLRQETIEFYNYFKESNNRVARSWFKRDNLFSEDFSMYPETLALTDPQLTKMLLEDFIKHNGLIQVLR